MLMYLSSFSGAEAWLCFGVIMAFGTACAICYGRITRKYGLHLVEDWARLHQFRIMSVHQPTIVPFWKSGRGFQWFRVALQDTSGTVRQCWLRCKDFAVVPDSMEVIWYEKL